MTRTVHYSTALALALSVALVGQARAGDAPSSVTVLREEDFRIRSWQTLAEALARKTEVSLGVYNPSDRDYAHRLPDDSMYSGIARQNIEQTGGPGESS